MGLCTGIISCITFFGGCHDVSSSEGELAAKRTCGSCHVFPEPKLLPRAIWADKVLPAMGVFANFYRDQAGGYRAMTAAMIAAKDPVARGISFQTSLSDWNRIVDFYLDAAPQQLPDAPMQKDTVLRGFEVLAGPKLRKAFTSSVYIDRKAHQILVGSIVSDSLIVLDDRLHCTGMINDGKGIVDVSDIAPADSGSRQVLFTHVGSIRPEPPTMNRRGYVAIADLNHPDSGTRLADSLDRPVKALLTDVNRDGQKDLVVCQFGFLQGEVSLFINKGKSYAKKTLSSLPGAIDIKEDDINHDGMPDFWVLFAAAYEGIVQFINKGNGEFEQRQVASFPPCYGSSSFQLVDFNMDGKTDILYTCGDNADYSQVLKPYHGIYLFENTGDGFRQVYFFPMHGCYKAIMADYDLDGDMDIAAIAFFADYAHHPEEGFVYLENAGKGVFSAHSFPLAGTGRWVCMTVGDYDGDGDPDILLGNMAAKPGDWRDLMLAWMNGPELVVLRNKTR